jgi:phosphosulfolactate synthase
MERLQETNWVTMLADPSGQRKVKPRRSGVTMVIDKGLGLTAFHDMLQTSGPYIDVIKLGFGTSALYPNEVLAEKIRLCQEHRITIMPGGTFLEIAVLKGVTGVYLDTICRLGFSGVEVSDGTIQLSSKQRGELIARSKDYGLRVYSEYGKKLRGSRVETDDLLRTICTDLEHGSEMVTVEGRESGRGVGIYDDHGNCNLSLVEEIQSRIPDPHVLLWEAPLKSQQVELIQWLGPSVNLGNIPPDDILSVEALRRGLRSDTLNQLVASDQP